MARIRFNISAALRRWRDRHQPSELRFRMMNLASLDDAPRGPGWFDSSWDLDHGLEVEVALPGDPPFQAWIEAQARAVECAACPLTQALQAEDMLEFEPVDWQAWVASDEAADPPPALELVGMDMPEPALELKAPELELELV